MRDPPVASTTIEGRTSVDGHHHLMPGDFARLLVSAASDAATATTRPSSGQPDRD
jgi:hypothetical protein